MLRDYGFIKDFFTAQMIPFGKLEKRSQLIPRYRLRLRSFKDDVVGIKLIIIRNEWVE